MSNSDYIICATVTHPLSINQNNSEVLKRISEQVENREEALNAVY